MFGNGENLDLLKLYSIVREKGSYETVSEKGLWGLVAEELGFGSYVGPTLKFIYSNNLGKFSLYSQELKNAVENSSLKELDTGFCEVVSDVSATDRSCFDTINVNNSCENSDIFSRKRKREGYSNMLSWVLKVARDPCDPELGSLPDKSKWKSYGEDKLWKKVLIARETMILKRNEQSLLARPMHPLMYEDTEKIRSSRRVIPPKNLSLKKQSPSESSSGTNSDVEDDFVIKNEYFSANSVFFFLCKAEYRKRVQVGPRFQAHIPKWTKETYDRDSKWEGLRVWPLESGERKKHIIERERMGKGRQDSCGCQFQGSVECVRFHISEKITRVKLELGSAFYYWKFDKMGEKVALSWTKTEEEKFQGIIRSNPPSLEKCFWDEISKAFTNKKRDELVSYYFNVFLLHRRIYQNRSTPINIDSDDEESEFVSLIDGFRHETGKSPSSIFYSPKKAHLSS